MFNRLPGAMLPKGTVQHQERRPKTALKWASSGAVISRNWVKTSIFSWRAATTSAISQRRAHLPLSSAAHSPSFSHCDG